MSEKIGQHQGTKKKMQQSAHQCFHIKPNQADECTT